MRIFQNSGLYPAYIPRLRQLTKYCETFPELIDAFLGDRFGACHFLKPVLERQENAFFTNGDDAQLQHQWALEHGMKDKSELADILLAQIEEHKTEVFYNLDPMRYQSDFIRKLPGCVKKSIAWRAAPSPGADFSVYNLLVCNFPQILANYAEMGLKAAWFSPSHDPVMESYADCQDRPIDVVFVGGYTRHHKRRAELLDAVAGLRLVKTISFHLDNSRMTRLSESILGRLLPLNRYKRPDAIRNSAELPVFGLDLYTTLARAKIVLNGAIDMAGLDRGNMRCFEAMGCGSLLLSDEGNYPAGMIPGANLVTYSTAKDAVNLIKKLLGDDSQRMSIAKAGRTMLEQNYSKTRQWDLFIKLAE